MQLFELSEATAARRRFFLHLVDATDGITPETGEAGGQPQISKNGAAFGNTSATLTAIGNGLYYVELTAGELDTLGVVAVRYKSANTAEFQDIANVVAYDPFSATNLGLTNLDAAVTTRATPTNVDDAEAAILAAVDAVPTAAENRAEMDSNSAKLASIEGDTQDIQANMVRTVRSGTAQAGAAGSITLDAGASATSGLYTGTLIQVRSGTGAGQTRLVYDYDGSTKVALIYPSWATNPDNTSVFDLLPAGPANLELWRREAPFGLISGLVRSNVDGMSANVLTAAALAGDAVAEIVDAVLDEDATLHLGPNAVGAHLVATYGDVGICKADLDNIQTRLPAALVGGRMDSSVGAMEANVLAAAALAADAVAEIQSGLATAGNVDDAEAAILAAVPSAVAIAEAVMKLDLDTVEGTAAVHSLCTALLKLVGKTKLEATLLRIYRTDGATTHATQPRTVDATLQPTSELGGAV